MPAVTNFFCLFLLIDPTNHSVAEPFGRIPTEYSKACCLGSPRILPSLGSTQIPPGHPHLPPFSDLRLQCGLFVAHFAHDFDPRSSCSAAGPRLLCSPSNLTSVVCSQQPPAAAEVNSQLSSLVSNPSPIHALLRLGRGRPHPPTPASEREQQQKKHRREREREGGSQRVPPSGIRTQAASPPF